MTSFSIILPDTFTFSQSDNWPKWLRQFEHIRQVSGLQAKSQESQKTLLYTRNDLKNLQF